MSIRQNSFFIASDASPEAMFSGSLKSSNERPLGKRSGFWVTKRVFPFRPGTDRIADERVSRFVGKLSRSFGKVFLLRVPSRRGDICLKHAD